MMHNSSIHKKVTHSPLITGTLTLTISGFLTRIMGFFHRIYLSQLIDAREMGIYQLIFPVYMVTFAFCCHGIELALSQMVASIHGKHAHNISCHNLVKTASALSLICSLLISITLYYYADFISTYLLNEPDSTLCLKLLAPVLPFTAVRCCLHGYYIGIKKTSVPAVGQLIEQAVRIFIIWLIATSYSETMTFTAALAVCGMVIGEIAGTIYTYISYKIHTGSQNCACDLKKSPHTNLEFLKNAKALLSRAIPLTGNKLSLTLASSLEAVLIPFMLTKYYQNQDLALSIYGVLTGMALPFITFPSTLTNSLSVMLLPTISEAHASGNTKQIRHTIKRTVKLCLSLGFTALIIFFFFGKQLGSYVFNNPSAGDFLFILSFLCPFFYMSSSGTSILNGLGLMKNAFFYSLTGIGIRIGFIVFAVPELGIQGYLIGLLMAQLVMAGLQWGKIRGSV